MRVCGRARSSVNVFFWGGGTFCLHTVTNDVPLFWGERHTQPPATFHSRARLATPSSHTRYIMTDPNAGQVRRQRGEVRASGPRRPGVLHSLRSPPSRAAAWSGGCAALPARPCIARHPKTRASGWQAHRMVQKSSSPSPGARGRRSSESVAGAASRAVSRGNRSFAPLVPPACIPVHCP